MQRESVETFRRPLDRDVPNSRARMAREHFYEYNNEVEENVCPKENEACPKCDVTGTRWAKAAQDLKDNSRFEGDDGQGVEDFGVMEELGTC